MGHLQRTPSITVSFNLNAELPYKKLMKKPEKFRVKESSILIGLEFLGSQSLSLWAGWCGTLV